MNNSIKLYINFWRLLLFNLDEGENDKIVEVVDFCKIYLKKLKG